MAIILSLDTVENVIWAAGPQGLFRLEDELAVIAQPMERLACALALPGRLLVGGEPHAIAYSADDGQTWQAAWTEDSSAALAFAADPNLADTGVILAATEGDGILRSTDRGRNWYRGNFGLRNDVVLALAWAPPAPAHVWPQRQVVFAGTEEGLYRSPNGGRAWRRACLGNDRDEAVFQSIAVSPTFHSDGMVLAGSETRGLWHSTDGGRSFARIESAPEQVNAVVALEGRWLLSDAQQLWLSEETDEWRSVAGSTAALVLHAQHGRLWAGGEDGVRELDRHTLAVLRRFDVDAPALPLSSGSG